VFEDHAAAKATHACVLNGPACEAEQNQRNSLTGRAPFWGIFFPHRAAPSLLCPHTSNSETEAGSKLIMCCSDKAGISGRQSHVVAISSKGE